MPRPYNGDTPPHRGGGCLENYLDASLFYATLIIAIQPFFGMEGLPHVRGMQFWLHRREDTNERYRA